MHPPRHRRIQVTAVAAALAAAVLVLAVPGAPAAWADDVPIPPGYTVTAHDSPAAGVEHFVLSRTNPAMVVNVARIAAGAPVSLRAVLSNDEVAGDPPNLETTSSMCARVHCVLGVNADFFGDDHEPLGAFVTDGALLRSPSTTHHQLSLTADGTLTDQTFAWTGKLLPTDLQGLDVGGVNVDRPAGKVVLYTPANGPTTGTTTPGVDLVLRVVEPAGEFRLGQTARVEMLALNEGAQDALIPPDGAILSADGAGADALRSLWARVGSGAASRQALLRVSADEAVSESVGGSPILVRDGKRWFGDPGDDFTDGRHPRTMVGWVPGGDTMLVTVDGRQPGISVGMSLFEATDRGGRQRRQPRERRAGPQPRSDADPPLRPEGRHADRPRGTAGGQRPRGRAEHRRVGAAGRPAGRCGPRPPRAGAGPSDPAAGGGRRQGEGRERRRGAGGQ